MKLPKIDEEKLREIVVQAWCVSPNNRKPMDVELAETIIKTIVKNQSELLMEVKK